MAYKGAQQTLYDSLKSRGIDARAEKGKERYLTANSTLPIHGTEDSPLTTTRIRIMFRTLGRQNHLSGLKLSEVPEARTFSQLTAILANSTQHSEERDIQHEAALAYVDFQPAPVQSAPATPVVARDSFLRKIRVGVPATRPGYPAEPLDETDLKVLQEIGLIIKD